MDYQVSSGNGGDSVSIAPHYRLKWGHLGLGIFFTHSKPLANRNSVTFLPVACRITTSCWPYEPLFSTSTSNSHREPAVQTKTSRLEPPNYLYNGTQEVCIFPNHYDILLSPMLTILLLQGRRAMPTPSTPSWRW